GARAPGSARRRRGGHRCAPGDRRLPAGGRTDGHDFAQCRAATRPPAPHHPRLRARLRLAVRLTNAASHHGACASCDQLITLIVNSSLTPLSAFAAVAVSVKVQLPASIQEADRTTPR